jgi:hypothetical protein
MTVRVALTQKLRDKIPSIAAVQLIEWCNIFVLYVLNFSVKRWNITNQYKDVIFWSEKEIQCQLLSYMFDTISASREKFSVRSRLQLTFFLISLVRVWGWVLFNHYRKWKAMRI